MSFIEEGFKVSKACNLCREIMWPDPQALDLGAILIIAAVKKVGGPGPVPSHQLKA
jgi:hypothetical protein